MLREEYAFITLPNNYLINKRRLPADPLQLKLKEQFIFPMNNTKDIQHFYTIPEEWIQIPTTNIDTSRQIPNTNEELNKVLQLKDPDTITHFLITNQTNIANVIELLKQHFDLDNVPNFIFAVNDLPPPQ